MTDQQELLEAIADGLGMTTADISLTDSFAELKASPEQLGALYHHLIVKYGVSFTPEERVGINTVEELIEVLEDKQFEI